MGREIITLQIGHYSNFVGTHWWNLQDATFQYDASKSTSPLEINHDVLYREGQTFQGEVTYTPRLISLDLKGSLGSLSAGGNLYSSRTSKSDVVWNGKVDVHKSEPVPKNKFLTDLDSLDSSDKERETCTGSFSGDETDAYKLEDSVKVWSDYLRPNLHPRSVHIINEYMHENTTNPFDLFSLGTSCWKKDDTQDEIENRIRNYAEESDLLQGFIIMMDSDNGFSGLGSSIMEFITEEYGNKTSFALPLVPVFSFDKCLPTKLINIGLSLSSLSKSSSLFSPLSLFSGWDLGPRKLPYINYQAKLPYHTSAILATALETTTLPLRKRSGVSLTLSDLQHSLVSGNRNAVTLSAAVPFPHSAVSFPKCLETVDTSLVPLVPGVEKISKPWSQSLVWRGFEPRIQDSVDLVTHLRWEQTATANTVFQNPCPAAPPYPQYFSREIGVNGLLEPNTTSQHHVKQFPVVGGLHSSRDAGKAIGQLSEKLNRINLKKMHQFVDTGLEEDDIRDNFETLHEFVQLYEH